MQKNQKIPTTPITKHAHKKKEKGNDEKKPGSFANRSFLEKFL